MRLQVFLDFKVHAKFAASFLRNWMNGNTCIYWPHLNILTQNFPVQKSRFYNYPLLHPPTSCQWLQRKGLDYFPEHTVTHQRLCKHLNSNLQMKTVYGFQTGTAVLSRYVWLAPLPGNHSSLTVPGKPKQLWTLTSLKLFVMIVLS